MSALTIAPSARRGFADDLAILRDYTDDLDAALTASDDARAAVALATLAQAVHQVQLHVDPDHVTCAALTHFDGRYVGPRASVESLDESIARLEERLAGFAATATVDATDPTSIPAPCDAPPVMVAVPEGAAEVRGVHHPAVVAAVECAALRAARPLLERAGLSPMLAAGVAVEHAFFSSLIELDQRDDVATSAQLVLDAVPPLVVDLLTMHEAIGLSWWPSARALVDAHTAHCAARAARDRIDLGAEPGDVVDEPVCSCTPLVGGRHGRGCDLYDGWAE